MQRIEISLSGAPVHLVLMWRPATPGKATMPYVLTIVALGILPYVGPIISHTFPAGSLPAGT